MKDRLLLIKLSTLILLLSLVTSCSPSSFYDLNPNEISPKSIERWLNKDQTDINERDDRLKTPLMWVSRYTWEVEIIEMLVAAGCDIDAVDEDGNSSLMLAIRYNEETEICLSLLEAGCDVNLGNNDGDTPLIWAVSYNKDPVVTQSLIRNGADITILDSNNRNLLIVAIYMNRELKIMRILLDAGVSIEIIREFCSSTPILGVCLGYQCVGQAFGGKVIRASRLMHGKTSPIRHDGKGIYNELSNPFIATRYHSLTMERTTLPDAFEISAWTEEGEIMGMRHKEYPALEGLQFHPESILTLAGMELLKNFLEMKI